MISDEAHRSISVAIAGRYLNILSVISLGLTATPKDYLKNMMKNIKLKKTPEKLKEDILLDTYNNIWL